MRPDTGVLTSAFEDLALRMMPIGGWLVGGLWSNSLVAFSYSRILLHATATSTKPRNRAAFIEQIDVFVENMRRRLGRQGFE